VRLPQGAPPNSPAGSWGPRRRDLHLLDDCRTEVGEGARAGDLAGKLAGRAEELHLVCVGEGRGDGVAVGGGEAELLPEGSGAVGEEPGVVGPVVAASVRASRARREPTPRVRPVAATATLRIRAWAPSALDS
jgi:hypothetical protein